MFAVKNIKKGTLIFSGDSDEIRWVDAKDLPKEAAFESFIASSPSSRTATTGAPSDMAVPAISIDSRCLGI